MKYATGKGSRLRHPVIRLLYWTLLLVTLGPAASWATEAAPSANSPATLLSGEGMYRKGLLPDGKPLRTLLKGDGSVPGTTYACVSCHLRSGVGSFDENVFTPPVNGVNLFKPRHLFYRGNYPIEPPVRPAYTEETLLKAIRTGVDPTGHVLNDIMPRYLIGESDAKILVAYLRTLSSQFSPGASEENLEFATVVAGEVSPEERQALINRLNYNFNLKNRMKRAFADPNTGSASRVMAEGMMGSRELAAKKFLLSVWDLKGAPETWRAQLEEYYRAKPVFALLGGISHGDWKPVHRFSEEHGIPCVFPITDFPVVSNTDWYTFYLSKGYYQEGESAARHLNSQQENWQGKKLVQIVRSSPEGEALAAGFQQTWQTLGHKAPVTLTLASGKPLHKDQLQKVLSKEKPAAIMVWDGPEALPALSFLAQRKDRPQQLFLSSRYLGKSSWSLPEDVRGFTFLTYPFAFSPYPNKVGMGGKQLVQGDLKTTLRLAELPVKDRVQAVTVLTDALTELLSTALMDLKGNYYRDAFVDVFGGMMEQQYRLFGRLSFGPGDRYASKGCFIVQLSKGADPQLEKKSEWEIR